MSGQDVSRVLDLLGGSHAVEQAATRADVLCVFAYGSQARGDYADNSDLELGVIGRTTRSRSAQLFLGELGSPSDVRAYPFTLDDLKKANPEVPFSRRIFTAELKFSSLTIVGEPIAGKIPAPTLNPYDLLEEHAMMRARLIDAMLAAREAQTVGPQIAWKATLMAARLWVLNEQHRLVSNRDKLRAFDWPYDFRELVSWMDFAYCCDSLSRQPDSIRDIISLATGPIYDAIVNNSTSFVPLP